MKFKVLEHLKIPLYGRKWKRLKRKSSFKVRGNFINFMSDNIYTIRLQNISRSPKNLYSETTLPLNPGLQRSSAGLIQGQGSGSLRV
jgi:hypothetical protein